MRVFVGLIEMKEGGREGEEGLKLRIGEIMRSRLVAGRFLVREKYKVKQFSANENEPILPISSGEL